MRESDLSFPIQPVSFGADYEFPEDLTKLHVDQIGFWSSRLAAYRGYVLAMYTKSEVRRRMLEEKIKLESAKCRASRRDPNRTQSDIKDEVTSLPEIEEFNKKMLEAEASTIYYSMLKEIYTGQIEVLSRELTRRTLDI